MNVIGTVRVLEAAARVRRAGRVLVDRRRDLRRVRPRDRAPARAGRSPYGIAKLCGGGVPCAAGTASTAAATSSLRFANVYGPRQEPSLEGGVVAIFLERLAAASRPLIYGDGTQTRDFVYVGDVAGAPWPRSAATGVVFNIGTGIETTVLELHAPVQR